MTSVGRTFGLRRPWRLGGIGLVLVAIDFRTTSLDLLPDPLGWLLVAVAVATVLGWRLAAVAGAAAVASLGQLLLPYHYIQYNPITGEQVTVTDTTDLGYAKFLEYDALRGVRLGLALAAVVLGVIVVWTAARRLEQRASARGVPQIVGRLRAFRWSVGVLWAVPPLIGMVAAAVSGHGYDPTWDDPASHVSLAGTLVLFGLGALLFAEAREPWALPHHAPDPVPRHAQHEGADPTAP